jgi:TonB family protein
LLFASAWKGTILLLAAFAVQAGLRRASAALRHFVWMALLAAMVALPVALRIGPRWSIQVSRSLPLAAAISGDSPSATVMTVQGGLPKPRPISWPIAIWMSGFAASAAWILLGAGRVRQIVRRGFEPAYARGVLEELRATIEGCRPVRLLASDAAPVPLACGIWHPTVVLPAEASEWPPARLRTVLLHELMHIQRGDLLAQMVAQAACCLYWFQPLAWFAARQLRKERERACDDAVLRGGVTASDYATHLTDLARSLAGRPFQAVTMAESSGLEARVRALLDRRRNRRPLSRKVAWAIALASMVAMAPLAVLQAQAPPSQPAVLAGMVQDASPARVVNCEVTARSLDGTGSNQLTTHTDAVGVYRFSPLPAGRYSLAFRLAGFAMARREVALAPGQLAEVDVTLTVGAVAESITVKGQRAAPTAPAAGTPQRIRVGGNVQPAKLIVQTKPVYPPELQRLGVEGSVAMRAVISATGEPANLEVVSTGVDSRLAQAALDAVRQWRYQPSLLNGLPVAADTTITIDFRLEQ